MSDIDHHQPPPQITPGQEVPPIVNEPDPSPPQVNSKQVVNSSEPAKVEREEKVAEVPKEEPEEDKAAKPEEQGAEEKLPNEEKERVKPIKEDVKIEDNKESGQSAQNEEEKAQQSNPHVNEESNLLSHPYTPQSAEPHPENKVVAQKSNQSKEQEKVNDGVSKKSKKEAVSGEFEQNRENTEVEKREHQKKAQSNVEKGEETNTPEEQKQRHKSEVIVDNRGEPEAKPKEILPIQNKEDSEIKLLEAHEEKAQDIPQKSNQRKEQEKINDGGEVEQEAMPNKNEAVKIEQNKEEKEVEKREYQKKAQSNVEKGEETNTPEEQKQRHRSEVIVDRKGEPEARSKQILPVQNKEDSEVKLLEAHPPSEIKQPESISEKKQQIQPSPQAISIEKVESQPHFKGNVLQYQKQTLIESPANCEGEISLPKKESKPQDEKLLDTHQAPLEQKQEVEKKQEESPLNIVDKQKQNVIEESRKNDESASNEKNVEEQKEKPAQEFPSKVESVSERRFQQPSSEKVVEKKENIPEENKEQEEDVNLNNNQEKEKVVEEPEKDAQKEKDEGSDFSRFKAQIPRKEEVSKPVEKLQDSSLPEATLQIQENKSPDPKQIQQTPEQEKEERNLVAKVDSKPQQIKQNAEKKEQKKFEEVKDSVKIFEQQKVDPVSRVEPVSKVQEREDQADPLNDQKQKIRMDSQFIESIPDDSKDKPIVEFREYLPTETAEKVEEKEKDPKQESHIETKQFEKDEKSMVTPIQVKGGVEIVDSETNDLIKNDSSAKKDHQEGRKEVWGSPSPRKEAGKIARKLVHDKKVHEIVQDLQKYDEKKGPLHVLEESKRSKKKANLPKLQMQFSLQSNVINLSIGDLTPKDEISEAERQLEQLKFKLDTLERKKQERAQLQLLEQQQLDKQDLEVPVGTIANFKTNKKHFAGRIVKKLGESRKLEDSRTNHQPLPFAPASRSRVASTRGLQTGKNMANEGDFSRTVNFRVRRPSRAGQNQSQVESVEKDSFDRREELEKEDECFQTSKREDEPEIIKVEEPPLESLEIPSERELQFEPNFREDVERFFVDLGQECPTRQFTQQELAEFAKKTFRKFGVDLQRQKSATLSVKKYKNCVSFILDHKRTIIWYYEGRFYYGGWIISESGEGQKTDWGYEMVPRKYVFSGQFKENKRHGYGVIKFLNKEKDTIYEGWWASGLKEGTGRQVEPDDSQYIGSWSQGKRHGYGTLKISEYEHYAGQFYQGVKHKNGTEVFKNGDMYVGQYASGKFHGKGIYTWANHSRYEGDFIEGARQGYGSWIANHLEPKTDKYDGHYKNDKKNGFGKYFWKDGTTYEGYFLHDLKHGEGIVSYGDGRTARLQWFEGAVIPRQKEKTQSSVRRASKSSTQKGKGLGKGSLPESRGKQSRQVHLS